MKKTLLFFAAMCVMLSAAVAQVSVWDGTHTTWTNGNGTETNPYLIENAQHLAYLAYYTNNGTGAVNHVVGSNTYWKLTINIDLNNLPWTPAGYYNSDADYYSFGGHLNGNGYTIANLSVNAARAGLFGRIEGGSMKNLGITGNSSVTGSVQIGGIIGWATGTFTLENCYYTGTVSSTGNVNVGGLIGCINTGSVMISNCYNSGTITSGNAVGGIVGYIVNNTSVTINNCYNTGNITGSNIAGGIIGYINNNNNSVTLNDCYNTGGVSSDSDAGGLIGYINNNDNSVTLNNCHNTGIVSSMKNAGGIISNIISSNSVTLNNCYNTETIYSIGSPASTFNVGGIIGNIYNQSSITLNQCHNTGYLSVTHNARGGGLIGFISQCNNFTIKDCYNKGNVSNSAFSGGLFGILNNSIGIINNCYNTGSISGDSFVGGIIGSISSAPVPINIRNSYNTGIISGTVIVGGIVGGNYNYASISNCHSLISSSSDPGGGTSQTEAFMKTQAFIDLLNNGPAPNSAYKLDNLLINSGYPILLWQGNNTTATLSNLTVSEGVLTPAFNSETYNYTVVVENTVSSITITATATDPAATVAGEGVKTLTVGANTFTITVTAADGTTTQDYTITVTRAVGIDENSAVAHITVYPNPTSGELQIENGELKMENVEVFDISGRKQKTILNSQFSILNSIDISELSAGVYFVKIRTEAGEVVRKVVKE